MKKCRKIRWMLLAALMLTLMSAPSGCRVLADEQADVVFVNCTDTPVGSVGLDSPSSSQGGQNADGSPMGRGESIGFVYEVSYPAVVTVYAGPGGETPLASCVIETEPEGGRWYVAARDSESGMVLEVGNCWPEGETGAMPGSWAGTGTPMKCISDPWEEI